MHFIVFGDQFRRTTELGSLVLGKNRGVKESSADILPDAVIIRMLSIRRFWDLPTVRKKTMVDDGPIVGLFSSLRLPDDCA